MIQLKILLATLTFPVLGAFAPGCVPAPDATLGSFCASPAEGGEYCVSANQSPAGAWNTAALHGGPPIQMWATPPSDVTRDELVASPDKLQAWFADIDTVLSYLRDTKSAESYQASMAGKLGTLLQQAKDRQAELRAHTSVDPIAPFKTALYDKARVEKSPLLATIVADKQAMIAVQHVVDRTKSDAAPLAATFAEIASQFTAYRASEAAETASYAALAQKASAASLDALPSVEKAILTASAHASNTPLPLIHLANKLSAQIQAFELAQHEAIATHTDFLATHGAALPDMTSSALRSLNAMLGYIQQRVARSDATATSLLHGIALRTQALVLLTMGTNAADTVAQAERLKAGATFHAASSARVTALRKAPPVSANLQLPYLAQRYDQLTALLQLQPLCDPASSSWREDGCASLRGDFGAAQTFLKTTLPALIQTGLTTMRTKGVDAALLDAALALLNAGDVKGAAMVYDAAVRSAEGT
jgi:hypothetical protein